MTLRDMRRLRGYTQKDLATLLGVSSLTIINWEKGRSLPTKRHCDSLSRIYGISPADVFLTAMEDRRNAVEKFGY